MGINESIDGITECVWRRIIDRQNEKEKQESVCHGCYGFDDKCQYYIVKRSLEEYKGEKK